MVFWKYIKTKQTGDMQSRADWSSAIEDSTWFLLTVYWEGPGIENQTNWADGSGRKNVLRKLLRIPYRRLKAGFSVCWHLFVCLSLREFWLRLNEMHKVWTFASRKGFWLLCGFCFSSLENYFGLGTTNVRKNEASIFLIVHSIYLWVDFAFFRRAELKPAFFISK